MSWAAIRIFATPISWVFSPLDIFISATFETNCCHGKPRSLHTHTKSVIFHAGTTIVPPGTAFTFDTWLYFSQMSFASLLFYFLIALKIKMDKPFTNMETWHVDSWHNFAIALLTMQVFPILLRLSPQCDMMMCQSPRSQIITLSPRLSSSP